MHAAYGASCKKAKRRATSPLVAIVRNGHQMLKPVAHRIACIGHIKSDNRMDRCLLIDRLAPLQPAALLRIQ